MPTKWLTSDLHLGHANIIDYCNRPYGSVDEMNNDLIRRWNERVQPEDTVFVLGDFAMGKLAESLPLAQEMNGDKFLVPGNHDRMFKCEGTKYANACEKYTEAGFSGVMDMHVSFAGIIPLESVLATRFPYRGDSGEHFEDRYQDMRLMDRGACLVHGHTHGCWRKQGRMIDVGVDTWGGYPVSFATVGELFMSKEDATPLEW